MTSPAITRAFGVSRYFDFDGPVHYYDFGGNPDGPLLVCVHGLGGSASTFDLIAPTLARYGRVYSIDLIGHGRTPVLGRSATVGSNRRVLDHFLAHVVGEPAILLGNSMGGLLAMLQSVRRPESVAAVVLIAPALPLTSFAVSDTRRIVEFLALATPGFGALVNLFDRVVSAEYQVARMMKLVAQDPTRVPQDALDRAVALVKERRRYSRNGNALGQAARSVVWVLQSPWYADQLSQVACPVLLIHGTHDRLMSIRHAHAAAERFDTWRFEVLNQVGHVPMIEEPEVTIATILDWLGDDAAAAAQLSCLAAVHEVTVDVSDSRTASADRKGGR